ncbi:TPA: hypothetical protein N0F65_011585 [Lagenidium giganteum]|uniref:EGF-like domain-containing protein n=1 Tax=Lagenidium giganteum TaxID=4803 RepID=A0AAV2ZA92_9STRA|nr:TPA: hypothetical protein N0F65_011585 [Lagenidium giganteum]
MSQSDPPRSATTTIDVHRPTREIALREQTTTSTSPTARKMTTRTSSDAASAPSERMAKQQKVWNVPASAMSARCQNPIRKIVDNIKKPNNPGKQLIPLSLGDPTVFGNFKCPEVLVEAIVRNARSMKHGGYIHSAGTEEARAAIASHFGSEEAPLTKDDVIIGSGCSGALELALTGLLSPGKLYSDDESKTVRRVLRNIVTGDNILLPKPGFPLYQVICDTHQIECRYYNLLPDKNWEVDLDHLQSLIDDNTKAILVNNPSNPCGSVYSKVHLQKILRVAEDNKIPIVADEIYGDMVFGSNVFYPVATLTKTVPVISVGGLAKQFLIPGWRVGWIMVYDRNDILKEVRSAYFKLSQLILGANSLVQSAIPELLTPIPNSAASQSLVAFKKQYYEELEQNSAYTTQELSKVPGLHVVVPQGAMYVMVRIDTNALKDIKDDCDFTQKLLDEESVMVLPGQAFGMTNYFRVVFSAPKEVLGDAYKRIADFCQRHIARRVSGLGGNACNFSLSSVGPLSSMAGGSNSMMMKIAVVVVTTAALLMQQSAAVGVVMVRGNKMYDTSTGERFFMKGMTYEYAVSDEYYTKYSQDVIATNLKGLKFNTLRVYNINPDLKYGKFMNDMAKLGVYVLVAASPDNLDYFGDYRYASLRKDLGPDPKKKNDSGSCYPAKLLQYGKAIAKNFAQYNNTLGMIIGNEIMQKDLTAAACVKQYAADLKTWMRANSKKMRMIPIAYAAADSYYVGTDAPKELGNPDNYHTLKIQGLLCGDKMTNGMMVKSIDIYLINEYRWCASADFSEYQRFLKATQGAPIVFGFGEYGCKNKGDPARKWPMVEYMYGSSSDTKHFTDVFSGGLAYSYGEASLGTDALFPMFTGGARNFWEEPSSKPTDDYSNLKSQFDKYKITSEVAGWSSDEKCSWSPKNSVSIDSDNKRASENGWLLSCKDSSLKVADSDTWETSTRSGAPCDDDGMPCEVDLKNALDITQEDLCGGAVPSTSKSSSSSSGSNDKDVVGGGGACRTAADCSHKGECIITDGEGVCQCRSCYIGEDCSVRDLTTCNKLSNVKEAPVVVIVIAASFLLGMLIVFCTNRATLVGHSHDAGAQQHPALISTAPRPVDMHVSRWLRAAVAVATLCASVFHASVDAEGVIMIRGNKMYNSKTGERFMLKGMTYEYAVSDEYYEKNSKDVIAKTLKGLDFNTLRLYNANPDSSYKLFMNDMAALGVYVMVSASPDNDPYYGKYRYSTITKKLGPNGKVSSSGGVKTVDITNTCYPALLLEYGKKVIKNFAQYDNTLGVVIANEIMQYDLTAAACVKQYAADLKSWMMVNGNKMRVLPLAYAAADSAYGGSDVAFTKPKDPVEYHVLKMQGLLCGDKMKDGMMQQSIDIYLINEYRWCPSSPGFATYEPFLALAGAPIVIAFGEYGCKETKGKPRTWDMVPYLYDQPTKTKNFDEIWSGGLAYSYGEAKLSSDSLYPMFTGGDAEITGKPSDTATTDYTNLKDMFKAHKPYSDPADWTKDTICTWAPDPKTTVDAATNPRASKYEWIPSTCDADYMKVASNDTWITKTREGAVCSDDGSKCDVPISSEVGTTQSSICGVVYKVESGGGDCKGSNDCGENGQCIITNGKGVCKCLPCYTGASCSVKDITSCSKLSSSKTAPKMIFIGVAGFLLVMLLVFISLAIVARNRTNRMNKFGAQLKLRPPQSEEPHQRVHSSGATL